MIFYKIHKQNCVFYCILQFFYFSLHFNISDQKILSLSCWNNLISNSLPKVVHQNSVDTDSLLINEFNLRRFREWKEFHENHDHSNDYISIPEGFAGRYRRREPTPFVQLVEKERVPRVRALISRRSCRSIRPSFNTVEVNATVGDRYIRARS